ncbi:MAG: cytochrome c3 family protein, partial [Bacteroidota bacterium]
MRAILTAVLGVVLVMTAQGQRMENRSHLVTGMKCTTCHSCEVPTKENPCVRICPRTNMATVHHSAKEGPDVVNMNTLSDSASLYTPVRFSHKSHAEMSEMAGGCTMCHHYNPPGRVLGCSECHEVARLRASLGKPDLQGAYHRQCLDCHKRWSSDTGCRSCHALRSDAPLTAGQSEKERNLGRHHPVVSKPARLVLASGYEQGPLVTFYHNEHVDRFGLECSQCHTSESCIRCHEKGKSASVQSVAV